MLLTLVDTPAPSGPCLALARKSGDQLLAGAALVGLVAACASWTDDRATCTIVAPVSPGLGRAVAAVMTLSDPDTLLGHELRHCMEAHFHPALLPFLESSR